MIGLGVASFHDSRKRATGDPFRHLMPPVRAVVESLGLGFLRARVQNALMCSHDQAEKRRKRLGEHFGIRLPSEWDPPRGPHIHPGAPAAFRGSV